MMKTTTRLAAGLGFYGDSWEPVRASIERGNVQYVCSDHLAELTLAILRKDLARDDHAGFTKDLVPMLTGLWPAASARGVKFVLNAGGLNPEGARDALVAAFTAKGFKARIAVVTGDALLHRIDALQANGEALAHMDTGASIATVRDRLVFANAYLGAAPIAQALGQGADIVLTAAWPMRRSFSARWCTSSAGRCNPLTRRVGTGSRRGSPWAICWNARARARAATSVLPAHGSECPT